jgi:hypothetical protein
MAKNNKPDALGFSLPALIDAYKRAASVVYAGAQRHFDAGNLTQSAELFWAARRDMADAIDAITPTGGEPPYPDEIFAQWKALAWTSQGASLGFVWARGGADVAARRKVLDEALALYDIQSAGIHQRRYLLATRANLLSDYQRWEKMIVGGVSKKHLWRCLETSQRALAANPDDPSDNKLAEGLDKEVAERARDAQNKCFDDVAAWMDARREDVNKLGSKPEAADSLRTLIDDSIVFENFRVATSPWDQLYHLIALEQLSGIQSDLGRTDAAEATRLEALRTMRPYIASLNLPNLTAEQAGLSRSAWERIRNGHHKWLDDLRNRAGAARAAHAIPLLKKVLEADQAWDSVMPNGPNEFDKPKF